MPGQFGYQAPRPRRRIFQRLGIGGAVLIVVIIVVSVIVSVHNNHTWKLTAPSSAAGMPRDTSPLDTLGLSTATSDAKSAITQVPGYGSVKSTVSAAYQKGSGPLVWFIGFNGSYSKQLVLKRYQGAQVVSVNAGPHGGAAECARSSLATLCQWSTSTTVGDLIMRANSLGGPVSLSSAESLLIKMRNSVEVPK